MTVLAEMQHIGCKADADQLRLFGKQLDTRIQALTDEIYEAAGHTFNIQSSKQLGEVLFGELELPVIKKTKSGYSTNAEVLEKLSGYHPIIQALLEYRQLTKLKSTYADGLLKGDCARWQDSFSFPADSHRNRTSFFGRPEFAKYTGAYRAGA